MNMRGRIDVRTKHVSLKHLHYAHNKIAIKPLSRNGENDVLQERLR